MNFSELLLDSFRALGVWLAPRIAPNGGVVGDLLTKTSDGLAWVSRTAVGGGGGGGSSAEIAAALEEMQNIKAACLLDNLSAVAQVQAVAMELRQQQ